ncbi:MAG: hypothetical protein WBL25_18075 [Anaerolineales bacterium]
MAETYPLALAVYDFVPVAFFLIGAIFFVRMATQICDDRCGRLAMAGSVLVFLGGFLKAIWKLLFTLGVGDFQLLSESQFVLLAPGFLALLVVVIRMARSERMVRERNAAVMLAMAGWKIPFLIVMTLASMGVQGILTYISFRRTAKLAASGFIVAFLCLVGMGAMASGEQTLRMQWIQQSVNSLGQLGFMMGSILLHKNAASSQTMP